MKKPIPGTVEYEIEKAGANRPKLLLHVCCGPCAAGTLANIADFFDITLYFYNPNIMPKEEFFRRLETLKQVISHFEGIKLLVPEQDTQDYLSLVQGMESLPEGGTRCAKCFEMRLNETARYLSEHKNEFDYFATTLTISPMKNATLINAIGNNLAQKYGVSYLASDFKKRDGYLMSTKLCKEWGIYRQHYCGCKFDI